MPRGPFSGRRRSVQPASESWMKILWISLKAIHQGPNSLSILRVTIKRTVRNLNHQLCWKTLDKQQHTKMVIFDLFASGCQRSRHRGLLKERNYYKQWWDLCPPISKCNHFRNGVIRARAGNPTNSIIVHPMQSVCRANATTSTRAYYDTISQGEKCEVHK